MARKLIGIIGTSGMRGPVGPVGPQGPAGPKGDPADPLPYASLERLGSYLFKITYDELPEVTDGEAFTGACSSYVKDLRLYRNLDWNYDETPEYIVVTNRFTGMAFGNNLAALPYSVNDGVNEDHIMVSCHVLFNDWDFEGSGDKSIPMTRIPFLILNNLHSINDINDIQEYLDNINIMDGTDYILQYMVTDGLTTYVIGPSDNGYEIVDATNNPKLTNFKWVEDSFVDRHDLQERPVGVERFNAMPRDLIDLRYTIAYEYPYWLSEFIGERGTTKDSTDEELMEIYEIAHQMYLDRERDGSTWQTMHSVVYSRNGIESLYTQENYNVNYIPHSVSYFKVINGELCIVYEEDN